MAKSEKELLEEIVAKLKESHEVIKNLKGKSTYEIMVALLGVLPDAVLCVEELGGKLDSADKRELAIEACLQFINVKLVPDAIERKLLGAIIDVLINTLNKWFGKDWGVKVFSVFNRVISWIKKIF